MVILTLQSVNFDSHTSPNMPASSSTSASKPSPGGKREKQTTEGTFERFVRFGEGASNLGGVCQIYANKMLLSRKSIING